MVLVMRVACSNLKVTITMFDGSLQGLESKNSPAFGFQGHPEASPGPHDAGPCLT